MQKAVPAGHSSTQHSEPAQRRAERTQTPTPQTGNLAQLAAMANRSPRVQTQRKLAEDLQASAPVEAQRSLAAGINAGSPMAAQLKRLDEKKTAAVQPKSKLDEKKTAAVQPKSKLDEKKTAAVQPKSKLDEKKTAAVQPKSKLDEKKTAAAQPKLDKKKPATQAKFADESPAQRVESPSPNRTGLPDQLKSGVEGLSGMSMDNVKVHYNSPKPAQLNALAYAQGTDIHVGPGQEQHLPHEAWHVVQQSAGRVKPTTQTKGVAINDDAGLEHEADVMGAKATQRR